MVVVGLASGSCSSALSLDDEATGFGGGRNSLWEVGGVGKAAAEVAGGVEGAVVCCWVVVERAASSVFGLAVVAVDVDDEA